MHARIRRGVRSGRLHPTGVAREAEAGKSQRASWPHAALSHRPTSASPLVTPLKARWVPSTPDTPRGESPHSALTVDPPDVHPEALPERRGDQPGTVLCTPSVAPGKEEGVGIPGQDVLLVTVLHDVRDWEAVAPNDRRPAQPQGEGRSRVSGNIGGGDEPASQAVVVQATQGCLKSKWVEAPFIGIVVAAPRPALTNAAETSRRVGARRNSHLFAGVSIDSRRSRPRADHDAHPRVGASQARPRRSEVKHAAQFSCLPRHASHHASKAGKRPSAGTTSNPSSGRRARGSRSRRSAGTNSQAR